MANKTAKEINIRKRLCFYFNLALNPTLAGSDVVYASGIAGGVIHFSKIYVDL